MTDDSDLPAGRHVVHGTCILASPDATDADRARCRATGAQHELTTRLVEHTVNGIRVEELSALLELVQRLYLDGVVDRNDGQTIGVRLPIQRWARMHNWARRAWPNLGAGER